MFRKKLPLADQEHKSVLGPKEEALALIKINSTKTFRHDELYYKAQLTPFLDAAKSGATLEELMKAGGFANTLDPILRKLMLEVRASDDKACLNVAKSWEELKSKKVAPKTFIGKPAQTQTPVTQKATELDLFSGLNLNI